MKCQNENTTIYEIVTNIKSKYVFLQFLYMKNEKRIRWVFVIKNNLNLVMNFCA